MGTPQWGQRQQPQRSALISPEHVRAGVPTDATAVADTPQPFAFAAL